MILLSSAMNSRRAVLLTPCAHVERDVLAKNTYEHVVGARGWQQKALLVVSR